MAVEILTDRGHLSLFDQGPFGPWDTMPQDFQAPNHPPFDTGADPSEVQFVYTEGAAAGDGMPPPPVASASSSGKKRKPSRPKFPTELRRPASTPQIRGVAQPEQSPLASPNSEKRRNKLGYHRTSVACGHCRRRKIRCLLAIEDPGGRCLNCIRLKKECHFFPVDQAPGDPKPRAVGSAEGSAKPSGSTHSSPRTSAASDSVDDPSRAPGQLRHAPFSMQSSKQGSEVEYSESPIDAGNFQSPTFSYQGMPESAPWSQPTFFGSQSLSDDPNTPHSANEYFPHQPPPNPAMFQHRGSIPVGLDQPASYYVGHPTEGQHSWAGIRSMSVGDASQLPPHLQSAYRQPGFNPGPYPYPYPPGPNADPAFGQPEQEVPLASSVPHVVPSQSFPQGWNTFPSADPGTPVVEHGQGMFGGPWYNEAAVGNPLNESGNPVLNPEYPTSTHPG